MSVNRIRQLCHVMSGPQGPFPPSVHAEPVAGSRFLATSQREIEAMFANIVAAVKQKVFGWVQAVGDLLIWTRPVCKWTPRVGLRVMTAHLYRPRRGELTLAGP